MLRSKIPISTLNRLLFTKSKTLISPKTLIQPPLLTTQPRHRQFCISVSKSDYESIDESSSLEPVRQRVVKDVALEGGLDVGVYKAIIVGRIGQSPLQKRLKNGKAIAMTTVGTGGIRNERIPFPNEEPREYADRCIVQWHRVAVYHERLANVVMKHAQPGSIVYVEGNLETKIFTDQITGLVRRIREIAVRQSGRMVFLGNDKDFSQPSPNELRGIGYF